KLLGGAIDRTAHREYGHARVEVLEPAGPFRDLRKGEHLEVWMSHGDKVSSPPRGFHTIARSDNSPYCELSLLAMVWKPRGGEETLSPWLIHTSRCSPLRRSRNGPAGSRTSTRAWPYSRCAVRSMAPPRS